MFEVTVNFSMFAGRDSARIQLIKEYLLAVRMFRNYEDDSQDPKFTEARSCAIICYWP